MKKSDQPLITIVVPVYNLEEYASESIDSILAQTYKNIEIILIDDGSTDQSARICDTYKKQYNNVKVIHQKNAGLSAARNTGLEKASGKYIAFIDGDDLISPNFVARLFQAISETDSDIAICNFVEFFEKVPQETKESEIRTASRNEAVARLLVGQENRDVIVCNKLFRTEIIKNIRFPVGELHEDNLTTYKMLAGAKKVANIDDGLYYYRQRPGSITAEQNLIARLKTKERAAKEAIKYFDKDPELKKAAEVSLLLAKFAHLDNVAFGKIHEQGLWEKTLKEINAIRHQLSDNQYLTKKLKLYLGLTKSKNAFLYKLFRKIKR